MRTTGVKALFVAVAAAALFLAAIYAFVQKHERAADASPGHFWLTVSEKFCPGDRYFYVALDGALIEERCI